VFIGGALVGGDVIGGAFVDGTIIGNCTVVHGQESVVDVVTSEGGDSSTGR
jgi:hypothetical protein